MADELIDIYDENNKSLRLTKMKSEAHKKGLWHRASHIWIYNSKGEMLLQLRAKDKETYPNKWDISAAGHAGAGETPIITALREVKEELDLSIKEKDLEFIRARDSFSIYGGITNREHQSVYLMRFEGNIGDLHAQKEEIQEIKFFKLDWLEKDIAAHPEKYVLHSGGYWLNMIKLVRQRLGAK